MANDPPLWDKDGKPIYLSENERMMNELFSTGKTSIVTGGIVTTVDFNEKKEK